MGIQRFEPNLNWRTLSVEPYRFHWSQPLHKFIYFVFQNWLKCSSCSGFLFCYCFSCAFRTEQRQVGYNIRDPCSSFSFHLQLIKSKIRCTWITFCRRRPGQAQHSCASMKAMENYSSRNNTKYSNRTFFSFSVDSGQIAVDQNAILKMEISL